MIAVINSVLVGTFVGLLLAYTFAWPLPICTGVGVVGFLVSVTVHQRYHWLRFKRIEQRIPALFPDKRVSVSG
jgi:low affinity Fe/Cu permease